MHPEGYREFHRYLEHESEPGSEERFEAAVLEMKLSTRQYARRQVKWIKNKFLPSIAQYKNSESNRATEIFLLDSTGLHCVIVS